MREISLTQGKVALVDDVDFESLNQHKWYAHKNNKGSYYALRNVQSSKGTQQVIRMHRQILGLRRGDLRQGDHIDHNTLDNRRNNLRICTNQQNQMGMRGNQNTTSIYKGVSWHKKAKKWMSCIRLSGKTIYLGLFKDEKVAALIYNLAAIKYFGEFAHLNFS